LKSIFSECDTVVPFVGDFIKISGGVLSTVKENVFWTSGQVLFPAQTFKLTFVKLVINLLSKFYFL